MLTPNASRAIFREDFYTPKKEERPVKKLFGYAPGALIRLEVNDYNTPISSYPVSFISICVGSWRKTFGLYKGFNAGWLLYKFFYGHDRVLNDWRRYWRSQKIS